VDISSQSSKTLNDFQAEDFEVVISLCGCGVNLPEAWLTREVFEDWQLDDPDGQPLEVFHRVRDEIKDHVQKLLRELLSER